MSKSWIAPSLVVVALMAMAGSRGSAQAPAGSPAVTEEVIAEKDAGAAIDDEEDVVSTDGRHVAWRTGREKKWGVMLDGQRQGGDFEEVKCLTFSADGRHLAFAARREKAWMIVLDGKEPAQTFERVSGPLFSPDGMRLVHFGRRQGKWTVIMNGESLGAPFDDPEDAMFSPDGQRLAVVGRRGSKRIVMVDLKDGPPFDVVAGVRFSADSRRFGYVGADIKSAFGGDKGIGRVVIDGDPGPQFEGEKAASAWQAMSSGPISLVPGYLGDLVHRIHGVSAPVFSPDGSRVAYTAHRGKDDEVVIVDGQPGPQFPAIVAEARFCPRGKRVAYAARRDKNDEVVIIDGQPGPKFASIVAGPGFCREGQHVAYVVSDSGAKFLVVDGERVGGALLANADFVSDLAFAPDGKRVGYVATAGSWLAAWARNMSTGINSSEKAVGRTAKRRVYVDGEAGKEYDSRDVSGPSFTGDSSHVIYTVHGLQDGSRKVSFVVTDRAEAKRYDAVWTRTLTIRESGELVYVAQSARKFVRVTQPVQ